MNSRKPTALYRNLSKRGFKPTHVAEVGVHSPTASNVYDYIVEGAPCILIEPDPDAVAAMREEFGGRSNVIIQPFAVHEVNGPVRLVRRGPSTFVEDVPGSPAAVNDKYVLDERDVCVVEGRKFDTLDDGTIDLLSIDVEGCEWFVIKNMKSRPRVISVETHGSLYENPYLSQIEEWMRQNGYRLIYRNTSDSIYARAGALEVTAPDRIALAANAVYLAYRRVAKMLKHRLSDLVPARPDGSSEAVPRGRQTS